MMSERMLANVSLVPIGAKVADIGCDHGFVSIHLYENHIASKVIAMDANRGPLERAKKHIKDANLSTVIECRLSNGMESLASGEVDTVLIGGMGGALICSILSANRERFMEMQHIILQPQSELDKVRYFLHDSGFAIQKECIVCETRTKETQTSGKYYTSIYASQGKQQFEKETEYLYGRYLIQNKDMIFKQYIAQEKKKYESILSQLEFSNRMKLEESTSAKVKKILKILQEISEMEKCYE